MRKCHYPAVRSAAQIPSPTARTFMLAPMRSTAASQPSAALHCTAQQVALADRPRFAPLRAHIMAVLHRPCSLPGVIDHGCDSAACGRTGDTREHKRCACTPSRAHIPAFTASATQTAGAPAPPPPMKVEAWNDTSTPPHTAGVSTHSTPGQYVAEYHREYSKVPRGQYAAEYHREYFGVLGCALIGGALQARTRQAIAQRTRMAPVQSRSSDRRRTSSQRRQVGPRAAVAAGR
jgi:hypothetical protein